jgi:hypothetical protein
MDLVMVAEAEAYKRGLQLAKDRGVICLAIEIDSN